ncbi:hypothetical protein IC006_0990 [Sulfuracidifex tepidarius]|uniref:Uncharacterized protein n=1 Tax=Sulfuracidifex tepidarius TaxID=1294262 RepID=A0A510DUG4_9CREN|nr:hypothetical protein IC006_0990 [Sulfuracidifex tepidarius]BBG26452.1 hypothetical protein IC007_0962 [Sulfuracidifex tepidarius]
MHYEGKEDGNRVFRQGATATEYEWYSKLFSGQYGCLTVGMRYKVNWLLKFRVFKVNYMERRRVLLRKLSCGTKGK